MYVTWSNFSDRSFRLLVLIYIIIINGLTNWLTEQVTDPLLQQVTHPQTDQLANETN